MLIKQLVGNWQQATVRALMKERARAVLFVPVILMLGIGLYFRFPYEPPYFTGVCGIFGACVAVFLLWKTSFRLLGIALMLVAVGFSVAQLRTHTVQTPLLAEAANARMTEGTIDEVIQDERGIKLLLSRPSIEDIPPEQTPVRIRVSLRKWDAQLQAGDRVRLRATLFPLPRPVMPGAFDFGRYFYFDSIGAVGFALGQAERIELATRSALSDRLNTLRHALEMEILAAMPPEEGSVSAALIMGNQGSIPQEVAEYMRVSGLAHVLSISGLHLALAAGIVFFAIRLLCVLLPVPFTRMHAKKCAAVAALIGAFGYLLLAGAPVPAQRSFIMVAFVLVAVLVDRRGISVYSLCWAATGLLLIYPEAMLGASFQMSFAATLAMVAYYEAFGLRVFFKGHPKARLLNYMAGIALTSLVATLATSAYVVYHFNRVSTYGMVANMLVLPLSSVVIMPGVVLSLVLMPFGIQQWGFDVLELGVRAMLYIAEVISNWPLATLNVPALTEIGLLMASGGLLVVCLLTTRLRLLGVPLIILAFFTTISHRSPDVIISDDARQAMVRMEGGDYVLLKGTMRAFDVQNWLRSEGKTEAIPIKELDSLNTEKVRAACTDAWCEYHNNAKTLIFVKNRDELPAACGKKPDVLVVWWYVHLQECADIPILIDRNALENGGAAALWLREEKQVLRFAAINRGRPWARPVVAGKKPNESERDDDHD